MRHLLPLLLLAVVGCNGCDGGAGGRQLAQPVDDRKPVVVIDPNAIPKPAASDPAAVARIDKAVREHSGGNPDALKALLKHTVTRTGKMFENGRMTETTAACQAAWPDRYRVEFRIATRGDKPYVMTLRGADGWHFNQTEGWDAARPLGPGMGAIMSADVFAEWLTLLVPLVERTDFVCGPADGEPVNSKPTKGVRVWFGDRPPVVLLFDEATARLVRVKYSVEEFGGLVPKSLSMYEHKTQGGVLVPRTMDYAANLKSFAQWAASEYEFPKETPAGRFEKP